MIVVPDTNCEVCGSRDKVQLSSSWIVSPGLHMCWICVALGAEPLEALEIYEGVGSSQPWFDGILTYVKSSRSGGGVYFEIGEVL